VAALWNFRDYVTIDDLDLEIHLIKENEVVSRDRRVLKSRFGVASGI
jgi:hypothetical protein